MNQNLYPCDDSNFVIVTAPFHHSVLFIWCAYSCIATCTMSPLPFRSYIVIVELWCVYDARILLHLHFEILIAKGNLQSYIARSIVFKSSVVIPCTFILHKLIPYKRRKDLRQPVAEVCKNSIKNYNLPSFTSWITLNMASACSCSGLPCGCSDTK